LKGLVTYDRAVKKDAFHWYRVNWNTAPAVHVADLRIPRRAGKAFDLPVYANRPDVELRIDGTLLPALARGVNDRHFWARGIVLSKGTHRVEARLPVPDREPAVTAVGEITVGD
jgi:beta-galactosidase